MFSQDLLVQILTFYDFIWADLFSLGFLKLQAVSSVIDLRISLNRIQSLQGIF